ncbi:MAG: protein-L-isoaspartate(D-aspartate) O-methyltransferase [Rhodospirillales bacterium]|nr:protein-L-isoaspartate(D-aspartate) O-methyltransferase [Rhodospirillales bacterium]
MMSDENLTRARDRLLADIEDDARDTEAWTGRRRFSDAVLAAVARVPRHEFVLPDDRDYAYINRPRGIGFGQTISQPYIVALMTDLLDLAPRTRVLEIGAGSGYQAAIMAEMGATVFTIEVIPELAKSARERLTELAYDSITVRHGDGFNGWPEEAPFDAIMVTAAPEKIPPALVEQLKPGGRMSIPTGPAHETQMLNLVLKDVDGNVSCRKMLPVAFVPMRKLRSAESAHAKLR